MSQQDEARTITLILQSGETEAASGLPELQQEWTQNLSPCRPSSSAQPRVPGHRNGGSRRGAALSSPHDSRRVTASSTRQRTRTSERSGVGALMQAKPDHLPSPATSKEQRNK